MPTPRKSAATPAKAPRPPRTPARATRASTRTPLRAAAPAGNATPSQRRESSGKAGVAGAGATGKEEGVLVAIRMRPLNRKEEKGRSVWRVLPKYHSVTQTTPDGKPLPESQPGRSFFSFDRTFGGEASTAEVYDAVARDIVKSTISGLNGTIFAYGQTSSGKTFTMQGAGSIAEGSVAETGGIVHLAVADIFGHIRRTTDRVFLIRASFLEIYNEEVRDLLSEDTRTLAIREDPRRGVFVAAEEEFVTDFDSLLALLARGEKSRQFASTAMNERSSRSHTIFRITIESRAKADPATATDDDAEGDENAIGAGDGAVRISTLCLVDLAGSESVRFTGATGKRQKEGGMINQSLLALSQVISSLGDPNQTHINYRDSKLTRILQPSLSGNARLSIVCCATPSDLYLEETRSTLQFASRAKLVKTRAQVNEVLDDRSLIRRLQKELAEARRLGGGSNADVVRALEEKAATVGSEIKRQEETILRLKSSILNSNSFFTAGSKKAEMTPLDPRKRRLSACDFYVSYASTGVQVKPPTPKTLPRNKKKFKIEESEPLLPADELVLIRDALSKKGSAYASLEAKLEEMSQKMLATEGEMAELRDINEKLCQERDSSRAENTQLTKSLQALEADTAEKVSVHEAAMAEKCEEVQGLMSKLSQEESEKGELEVALEALRTELAQQISAHEEAINALKAEAAEKASLHEADMAEKCEEVQGLMSKLSQEESEKGELEVALEALRTELAQQISAHEEFSSSKQIEAQNLISALEKAETEKNHLLESMEAQRSEATDQARKSADALFEKEQQVQILVTSLEEKQAENTELNASLEAIRADLSEQAAAHEEELSLKMKELQETANILHQKEIELSQVVEKVTESDEKCRILEGEVESLKATIISAEERIEDQSNTIESFKASCSAGEDEIKKLLEQIKFLQTDTAQSTQEWAQYKTDTENQLEELEKQKSMLAEQMKSELKSIQSLYEKSKEECSTFEQECMTLKEEISSLTESIESVKTELDSSVKEHQIAMDCANATVKDLQSQLDEAISALSDKEEKLAQYQNDLSASESKLAEIEKGMAATEEKLAAMASENDSLLTNLRETEMEKTQINEDLQRVSDELNVIQSTKSDLVRERDEQDENIAKLNEAVSLLNEKLSDQASNIAGLTSALQDALDSKNVLELDLSQIRCDLEKAQSGKSALLVERDNLSESVAHFEQLTSELKEQKLKIQAEVEKLSYDIAEKDSSLREALRENEDTKEHLQRERKLRMEQADDLISTHDMLESYNKQLEQAHQRINDLQDELLSKTTMLSQENSSLTNEIKEKDANLEELKETVERLTSQISQSEAKNNRLSSLETDIDKLLGENNDLKALLVSSNASVDHAKQELNKKASELDNALSLISEQEKEIRFLQSSKSSDEESEYRREELQRTQEKIHQLQDELCTERNERKHTEATLIQEAEKETEYLRSHISQLENEIKRLEADGYAARKLMDESTDREGALKQKYEKLQASSKQQIENVSKLNLEIERLRKKSENSSQYLEKSQSVQLQSVQNELQATMHRLQIREDEYSQLSTEHANAKKELSALKTIRSENQKLQEDITALRNQLESATEKRTAVKSLSQEIERLQKTLEEKNERIAKLDKNKLTKAGIEKIKKIQQENEESKERIKVLEKDLASALQESTQLRDELAHATQVNSNSDHVSRLKFDRDAMETRVRKLEADKRQLEYERKQIETGLRRCSSVLNENGDIAKAVISVCDQLESLKKADANTTTDASEIARVKRHVSTLESQNRSLQHRLDDLERKEHELQQVNAKLHADLEAKVNESHDVSKERVHDQSRKMLLLQNENLELYADVKKLKADLRAARAEIIRLQQGQDDTCDIDAQLAKLKNKHQPAAKASTGGAENVKIATMTPSRPPTSRGATSTVNKENLPTGGRNSSFQLEHATPKVATLASKFGGSSSRSARQTPGAGPTQASPFQNVRNNLNLSQG